MKCKHCGDTYTLERCPGGCLLKGECLECHMELAHGALRDPRYNVPCCGNRKPETEEDAQYDPCVCYKLCR